MRASHLCLGLVVLGGNAMAQVPVRDPHTVGYVKAAELVDGAVPPADADGNFILGPTHEKAAAMGDVDALRGRVVQFVMKSEDSKFYPGIECAPGPKGRMDADGSMLSIAMLRLMNAR